MPRWKLAVAMLAGVVFAGVAGSGADAAPRAPAEAPGRAGVDEPRAKPSRAPLAKRSRAALRKAKHRRAANRSNMPPGFTWPPSRAMRAAGAACKRALDAAAVAWKPARREGRIADAVTIEDGTLGGIVYVSVYRRGPHKLDCRLARALADIGPMLHAAGVREIRFGSIYRWSRVRVNGKTRRALSRHALGLAMDVVSFVDDVGREARVARDYLEGDPLLLEVERAINASGAFRLVLTPRNDPLSHDDHFHIEANPSYARPRRA